MELKYKSWDDVNINVYNKIVSIINNDKLEKEIKNVKLLSILYNVDEDFIWEKPVKEIKLLFNKLDWLNDFNFDKKIKVKEINIGKYKLVVDTNIQNYKYNQWVAYQNAINETNPDNALILSTILIPKGLKYGEGYDLDDVVKEIGENLPITTANSILFFYQSQCNKLFKHSLLYLRLMIKMLRLKMMITKGRKNKQLMEAMKQTEENLKAFYTLT